MKKINLKNILMGLGMFMMATTVSFADYEPYEYVEDRLELKYPTIKDTKGNTLKIDDIEIGTFNGKIYINMEVESVFGDGGWKKFDKTSYNQIMTNIANEVRELTETTDKIEIILVLDKEVGEDELLHTGKY